MWFSFWRSKDRFSLDQLRYLADQLTKVQIVNDVNKDFVIEALRSIAELITYGDQHDPSFFEFFMEKQVVGDFVRILKLSRTISIPLQLLQTVSIMIQNLQSEHAIYYMFSNEHMNYLITYSFDFRNDELLSYYISFLRAIGGKLNKNTISLLVKTRNDEVVSFPLYVEAIRFAFHEENMIRAAVRAVTLNVYHVGDDSVNRYITSAPHTDYFSNLVSFFKKQCMDLNRLISETLKNPGPDSNSTITAAVDEIEDNLYYFSDVISAGIPDVERLITDSILTLLIFPVLLPSLRTVAVNHVGQDMQSDVVTSLYLLCCILRIVKIKDLANTIVAALYYPLDSFTKCSEGQVNGYIPDHGFKSESDGIDNDNLAKNNKKRLVVHVPCSSSFSDFHAQSITMLNNGSSSNASLREVLLKYVTDGDDVQVLGSLSVLATLLRTKELDESMLDGLGILPQRKQQKKLLLQALVGSASGEEQLFSSESSLTRDGIACELDVYLEKIKEQYGVSFQSPNFVSSPRVPRFQVLDALVSLLCRSNISAETLWDGGWLLRQLLPYRQSEFNKHHLKLLKVSYENSACAIEKEVKGFWPDLLITVLCDEWRKCKRAMESSSPPKEPKSMLFPPRKLFSEDIPEGSSFTAGERMHELVKVFVLLHQLQIFTHGRTLPDQPLIYQPSDHRTNSRAQTSGLVSVPKPGTEMNLGNAVPCRIAFERGKERHFWFLAISVGTSGWLVLAEELPLKKPYGVVRVAAPLAGCNPRIDDKHSKWLHLRIRPSALPFLDPVKYKPHGKLKTKAFVDGRWILAFRDEESCKTAFLMILEEINYLCDEVHRRINPSLKLGTALDISNLSAPISEESSSHTTPRDSL
ncbi:protein TRANSPARENT TESTA 9-like isoform X2 [Trifolium pratense]|uniref:protein TRANSPARENT TESTA 9-like isoform X2 n=1 Tax=Trifolium pratense TaxID=57577 RepID=UPI001E692D2D|nr:protein TRANSPARENT TESTA 9-like isoform X2 [Trifolium pratense]